MLQLTFNPGLTLTGFRTTQPWVSKYREETYQKLLLRVSSGVPNTEKHMKARGRRLSALLFRAFGTPDETRSTSFGDDFSKETI